MSLKTLQRKQNIFIFLYLGLMVFAWVFATPHTGISDEPAHVVKASATARFQFSGPKVVGQFGYDAQVYRVPVAYSVPGLATCYAGMLDVPASCTSPLPSGHELLEVSTTAAHYPPLYYLVVGAPLNIWPGMVGFFGARLLSGLLTVLLTGWAYLLASRDPRRPLLPFGVLIGLVPTTLAFAGAINPASAEISGALLMATSMILAIVRPVQTRREQVHIALAGMVGSVFFALSRPASFVFMGAVIGLTSLAFGPRTVIANLRRPRLSNAGIWLPFCGFVVALIAYLMTPRGLGLGGGGAGVGESLAVNLRYSFERIPDYLAQMFGYFGWTELYAPKTELFLWLVAVGACLGFALVTLSLRRLCVLLMSAVAVVFAPLVLEGMRASEVGRGYQGRYMLSVAVLVPLISLSVARQDGIPKNSRRLGLSLGVVTVLSHLLVLNHVVRRFSVGLSGPLWWPSSPEWAPEIGTWVMVTTMLVATMAGVALIWGRMKLSRV
jgi:hypothetical protein